MGKNKRKNKRVEFNTEATITDNGRIITGHVQNLSLSGLFLQTDQSIEHDNDVVVTIKLSGSSVDISLVCTGKKIRSGKNGIAIEFKEMELDSYTILRSIVKYGEDN